MFDTSAYVFWILTTSLQLAVLTGLFRNSLFKSLPFFTVYTGFGVCRALGLSALIGRNHAAYFYSYWFCEYVSTILGFLVIREILMALLYDRPYWRSLA